MTGLHARQRAAVRTDHAYQPIQDACLRLGLPHLPQHRDFHHTGSLSHRNGMRAGCTPRRSSLLLKSLLASRTETGPIAQQSWCDWLTQCVGGCARRHCCQVTM